MIHVINIKKNYLYFFLLSLLISAVITLGIQSFEKQETVNENLRCSKHIIIETKNVYKSSVLFTYYDLILKKEILALVDNSEQINYEKNKIVFLKKDCDKNYDFIIEKLLVIEENVLRKLKELIIKIENKKATIPINDQVMVFDFENVNLVDIKTRNTKLTKETTKKFIQFFTFLFLMNFAFYLINKVRFIIK